MFCFKQYEALILKIHGAQSCITRIAHVSENLDSSPAIQSTSPVWCLDITIPPATKLIVTYHIQSHHCHHYNLETDHIVLIHEYTDSCCTELLQFGK